MNGDGEQRLEQVIQVGKNVVLLLTSNSVERYVGVVFGPVAVISAACCDALLQGPGL